jgi:hypothetical protein
MLSRNLIIVALATIAFIASQVNLAIILGHLEPGIFSLQLALTPEQFWRVIELWGTESVSRYQSHFTYDFIHPFIYGFFGYVCVRRTSLFISMSLRSSRFFAFALPVAGLCDLLENIIHVYLLTHGPDAGMRLVPISGTASAIKWSLAVIFTVVLLIQGLRTLYRKLCSSGQP